MLYRQSGSIRVQECLASSQVAFGASEAHVRAVKYEICLCFLVMREFGPDCHLP